MKIVWRNNKGLGILRSIAITQEDIDKIIDIIWNFVMDNYYGMKGIKDSNYQMIMVERVLDRKVKSSQFYKQSNRKMKLFIKDFARENYLYTKNGEYVIKTEEKTKKQKNQTKKDETYIIYACAAATILIILFIIIKHRKKKKSSK